MRKIILKVFNIKKIQFYISIILTGYVLFFLSRNLNEYRFLVSELGLQTFVILLVLSSVIHLFILPNRFWLFLKDNISGSFTFLDYLAVHTYSFLFSISPLGILGSEVNRIFNVNWDNKIKNNSKLYLLVLDRLCGLLSVLLVASYFVSIWITLFLIISTLALILVTNHIHDKSISIKRWLGIFFLSAFGFLIYANQINILIGGFLPDILFYESLLISALLIISAIIPFSFLGLSIREIAFQQILIVLGLSDSLAMKIAIMVILSDLIVNLAYLTLQRASRIYKK